MNFNDVMIELANEGIIPQVTMPIVEAIAPVLHGCKPKRATWDNVNWYKDNSASEFSGVSFTLGTMQSNDGDDLTYDSRVIAHALLSEVGWTHLNRAQCRALFVILRQDLDRRMEYHLTHNGTRYCIAYNASECRVERLYGNGQVPSVDYVKQAHNCTVVSYGRQAIALHVNGDHMVK